MPGKKNIHLLLTTAAALGLLLAGCRAPAPVPASNAAGPGGTAAPAALPSSTLPPPVSRTATSTLTPPFTATPTETLTPSPSPTPDPYAGLHIDDLISREYGGGEIQVVQTLAENSYFTRTLIAYPSDGLTIYGFMNVPARGEPPYPVVIANHGYIEPEIYDTIDYTTRYADSLARAGFLVLHPNLRGYPPSDAGDNLFRVGMAVDVLNLIALVQEQGGEPGPLELADPQAIGLWGHSMGGGVSTRVVTVSSEVDAVVLYAAMSAEERQNYEAINRWSFGLRGLEELAVPVEALDTISPVNYLDRIQAAVSVHHGRSDELVPLRWSIELCDQLTALEKNPECFWYENMPHTFTGDGDELFMQRVIDFFNRELRAGG